LLNAIEKRLNKHEKLIAAAEEKFKVLFENELTGILIYQEPKILFVNQTLLKILGYSERDLVGNFFSNIVYSEDRDTLFNQIKKCLKENEKTINTKVRLIDYERKIKYFDFFAGKTIINGKPALIANLIKIKKPNSKKISENDEFSQQDVEKMVKIILENKDYLSGELISKLHSIENYAKESSNDIPNIKHKENKLLTKREKEVLLYICNGLSNHEIAEKLIVSKRTVDGHRANILHKTGAKNTAELVMYSIKHGLIKT
jgi:PAS domain S-box-containing protein